MTPKQKAKELGLKATLGDVSNMLDIPIRSLTDLHYKRKNFQFKALIEWCVTNGVNEK
jgi:hypothetical protein